MLASAAVGTVEYRSMTEPIRVTNPFIDNYVEGRAIGIDVPNQKLEVQLSALGTITGTFKGVASNAPCRLEPEPPLLFSSSTSAEEQQQQSDNSAAGAGRAIQLNYDYLICAVGTSVRSTMVPGAKEHCFNLKTSQDSKRLRTAIGEALEYVRAGRWCLYSSSLTLTHLFVIGFRLPAPMYRRPTIVIPPCNFVILSSKSSLAKSANGVYALLLLEVALPEWSSRASSLTFLHKFVALQTERISVWPRTFPSFWSTVGQTCSPQ
jgi:hypothetical protein